MAKSKCSLCQEIISISFTSIAAMWVFSWLIDMFVRSRIQSLTSWCKDEWQNPSSPRATAWSSDELFRRINTSSKRLLSHWPPTLLKALSHMSILAPSEICSCHQLLRNVLLIEKCQQSQEFCLDIVFRGLWLELLKREFPGCKHIQWCFLFGIA